MNKKTVLIITMIVVGVISTLWLLQEDNRVPSEKTEQTIKTPEEEKLVGVWKQVQTFYKNTTTQQWVEVPAIPYLTLNYEFSADGKICLDLGAVHTQCHLVNNNTYTVSNGSIQIRRGVEELDTMPFRFIGYKLELITTGSGKIIFEKTIRPTIEPNTTKSNQYPEIAQIFRNSQKHS